MGRQRQPDAGQWELSFVRPVPGDGVHFRVLIRIALAGTLSGLLAPSARLASEVFASSWVWRDDAGARQRAPSSAMSSLTW